MKAIINVSKGSAYSQYNGLTFEVKEVLSKSVAVDINGVTTDFSFSEVMIVDIYQEVNKYKLLNEDEGYLEPTKARELANLIEYCCLKEIYLDFFDDSVTVIPNTLKEYSSLSDQELWEKVDTAVVVDQGRGKKIIYHAFSLGTVVKILDVRIEFSEVVIICVDSEGMDQSLVAKDVVALTLKK